MRQLTQSGTGKEDTDEYKHVFLVSGDTRENYDALRLIVSTNSHLPIALRLEFLALGWLGAYEVLISAKHTSTTTDKCIGLR